MSELVFSDTIERNRSQVPNMEGGRILLDEKFSVFRKPGKVCFVTSVLVCGVPKERGIDGNPWVQHNKDKRYYYWRSTDSYGFRRNSAGNIQPFECHRSWDAPRSVHWRHKQPRAPWQLLDPQEADMGFQAAIEFQRAVDDEFGIRKPQDLWPMMDHYGLIHPWTIPNSLKVGFRSRDMRALAEYAFGKKRVGVFPQLIGAVAKTDPYMVAYAQQFRGLVSTNLLVAFMEDNHFDSEMEEKFVPHSPDIRKALLENPNLHFPLINVRLDAEDLDRIRRTVAMTSVHKNHWIFRNAATRGARTWKDINR